MYKKINIYTNQRLLYCLNALASFSLQFATWLHQNFIFQYSNLAGQIKQKILDNLEKKNQLNRTIFTGFMPV